MLAKDRFSQDRKVAPFRFSLSPKMGNQSTTMKKLICILASAALLGACEQKTDVVAPEASSVPEKKSDKPVDPNTGSRAQRKTETTTTTTSSPAP